MIKRYNALVFAFILGIVVGGWQTPLRSAQFRATRTTDLMKTDLAGWCDGKEVLVSMTESAPGTSGKHYHPGHSFAMVLEGSQVRIIEGKPDVVAKAGDMLYEEPMEVHTSKNTDPVKILTFRILEKGKAVTTRIEESAR